MPNYVPHVPTCVTCSRVLRVYVSSCLCFLRAFLFYLSYVPSFFTCFTYPHFLCTLRPLIFFTRLTCLYIFTCLSCPHFLRTLRAFIFLRACNLFMYMLIKFTHKLMKTYSHLSYIFTSIKLVSYFSWVARFLKQKILITFNAEENTWPFEKLEHYLEGEIQGMLKSFTM